MISIIDLCKQGFDPKAIGTIKEIKRIAKMFYDKREIKIINETELVNDGADKKNYYLYVREQSQNLKT